jgi:4-amino-4-deoxy-L-arabinose transferase-like glycosyltransferase
MVRRLPLAAWICALVAIANGVCWSFLSPPFQTPDEPSHFAYVEHLAETGRLPSSAGEIFPPAEEIVLDDLLAGQIKFSQENHTISSLAEQETLERGMRLPLSRSEPGDAGVAASQPPLYYTLETIPYMLGSGGTVLDRLALMRLYSALMGGFTALFAFLFVREVLPGAPWAWTVGGLGVALAPLLGMMSGSVNPDALMFAVSTALFYCLSRAFRRGFTSKIAIAIGITIAIGCMTKVTFLGLVPGAILGLFALALREGRKSEAGVYRTLAIALAIAASPACIYVILGLRTGSLSLGILTDAVSPVNHHRPGPGLLSYAWQLYLPRLPGMSPELHGIVGSTIWFEQLVGKYGWLDTSFPLWVVKVALIPATIILALFARAMLINRRQLRSRWIEIVVYACMCVGILVGIAATQYQTGIPGSYTQFRYLLPLIAFGGIILALAARGAGRRWGPTVGVFIILLALAHDLFSQLLVISRYYG